MKTTAPLIWLETAQSTHLEAACSPGRGSSSEALLYGRGPLSTALEYQKAGNQLGKTLSTMYAIDSVYSKLPIEAPPDLLEIIHEVSGNATGQSMRLRMLAFKIQQLRAQMINEGVREYGST